MRKNGVITQVPFCADAPTASPCIESVYKTPGGNLHWVVRMNSTDPDLLPKLF
jgi:hypothetical protein